MAENNGEDKDGKVDLTQITEALKGLPDGVQSAIKNAFKEAASEHNASVEAARGSGGDKETEEENLEDFDVERVSRKELVNHIDKRFERSLSKALKPILDRLETTSTSFETDKVKREFAQAKEDFPDFMEWKEEMREIITAHPDLSASRIYRIARSENPEKAKKIDAELKEGKGEEDEKELSERKRAFGGLTPTSGSSLQRDGKKQPKEAGESAWDQVMGQVPKELLDQAMEG